MKSELVLIEISAFIFPGISKASHVFIQCSNTWPVNFVKHNCIRLPSGAECISRKICSNGWTPGWCFSHITFLFFCLVSSREHLLSYAENQSHVRNGQLELSFHLPMLSSWMNCFKQSSAVKFVVVDEPAWKNLYSTIRFFDRNNFPCTSSSVDVSSVKNSEQSSISKSRQWKETADFRSCFVKTWMENDSKHAPIQIDFHSEDTVYSWEREITETGTKDNYE